MNCECGKDCKCQDGEAIIIDGKVYKYMGKLDKEKKVEEETTKEQLQLLLE